MQITYFKCPECHKEYIVNVTDEKLRKDMLKAIELRNKMISDVNDKEAIRDYHIVKTKNCIRGKKLKEKYPTIDFHINVNNLKEIENQLLKIQKAVRYEKL